MSFHNICARTPAAMLWINRACLASVKSSRVKYTRGGSSGLIKKGLRSEKKVAEEKSWLGKMRQNRMRYSHYLTHKRKIRTHSNGPLRWLKTEWKGEKKIILDADFYIILHNSDQIVQLLSVFVCVFSFDFSIPCTNQQIHRVKKSVEVWNTKWPKLFQLIDDKSVF